MKLKPAAACLPGIKMENILEVKPHFQGLKNLTTGVPRQCPVRNMSVSKQESASKQKPFPAISILGSLEPVLCLVTRGDF